MAIMGQSEEFLIQQGKLFLSEELDVPLTPHETLQLLGKRTWGPIEAVLLSPTKTFG